MKFFSDLLHKAAHLTGRYDGKVVTWIEDKYIFIGFECSKCGFTDPKLVDKIESEKLWKKIP